MATNGKPKGWRQRVSGELVSEALGTAIIILFGERLLPDRNGATMPADFSRHARTLVEQYGLTSGIYQMRVRNTCPLVGKGGDVRRAC